MKFKVFLTNLLKITIGSLFILMLIGSYQRYTNYNTIQKHKKYSTSLNKEFNLVFNKELSDITYSNPTHKTLKNNALIFNTIYPYSCDSEIKLN